VFDRVLAEGDTGGVVVDITPSPAALATALLHRMTFSKKRLTPFMFSPSKADMELLVAMARQGKLKPAVDSCHPLSDAPAAWARSMGGHATGKVVVKIGEEE
jgi:NADPH:quinone reductase-like Zn-dependent oxidoreductase